MKSKKLYSLLLLSILTLSTPGLQILNNSPAIAQTRNTSRVNSWKTYVERNTYSISLPSKWIAERSSRELLIIYNQKPREHSGYIPLNVVKTDIMIGNISFNEKINNYNSNSGIGLGNEIPIRRERLNIGGIEAYRSWFATDNNKNISFVNTLFKYGNNQHISVSSFINPGNRAALPTIYRIHNSFRLLRRN